MKSQPKEPEKIRVTYIVPKTVYLNLEAYAKSIGRLKNDIVTEALSKYLREQGLKPDRQPIVSVSITYD